MFSRFPMRVRSLFFRTVQKLTLSLVRTLAIREFYALNEEAIEEQLLRWKESLRLAYQLKDQTRVTIATLQLHDPSYYQSGNTRYWSEQLAENDRRIASRLRGYDFARGLAYLMGFGKIVDKVSR